MQEETINRESPENPLKTLSNGADRGAHIERQSANDSNQQSAGYDLERFFDLSLDMLCIAGMDGRFKHINPSFQRTLGWANEELLGRQYVEFVHPDDVDKTLREMSLLSEGEPTYSFENRYRCADGHYVDLSWTSFPEKSTQFLYAVARDISVQREAQRQLQQVTQELEIANQQLLEIATVDPLTHLPNRRKFDADARTLIQLMFRIAEPVSLIMADIDHFKDFNDEYGHLEGDDVLVNVAKLLKEHKRESDVVARFGGEEFILLLPGTAAGPATEVAESIRTRVLKHPWPRRLVTLSLGVSTYCPHDEESVNPQQLETQLIGQADQALYWSKNQGRNQVNHFRKA